GAPRTAARPGRSSTPSVTRRAASRTSRLTSAPTAPTWPRPARPSRRRRRRRHRRRSDDGSGVRGGACPALTPTFLADAHPREAPLPHLEQVSLGARLQRARGRVLAGDGLAVDGHRSLRDQPPRVVVAAGEARRNDHLVERRGGVDAHLRHVVGDAAAAEDALELLL